MIRSKRVSGGFFKKFLIFLILFGIVTWLAFAYGWIKKDCVQNKKCFDDAAKGCKPSKYSAVKEGHLYSFIIKGSSKDKCRISITLQKMASGTPRNIVDSFEGKNMECLVPQSRIESSGAEEIKGLISYCTGPLKESIYELIIQKLYGLLIKNFNDILIQVQDQILNPTAQINATLILNKTGIIK